MKISASLIIKNEESMLGKCLRSISQCDEICIVDTGSTDNSIKIARKAGAKVYTEYKWADNFSEARNVSMNQCTGDWLLIIDADEILETTIPIIRDLISQPFMKDKNAVMFKVNTGRETNDQIRLFRNLPNIQWIGAAHNLPYMIENGRAVKMKGLHYSTFKIKSNFSPNHIVDPDRTLRIITGELRKGPQGLGRDQYTRYLYYVAREWLNRKDPIRALYFLNDYVKIAPPTNELADAWFLIASCNIDLGKLEESIDACLQVIKYLPSYKAPYAVLHNLSSPDNKALWERMFHYADNKGVLFVRTEAEKLIKETIGKKK